MINFDAKLARFLEKCSVNNGFDNNSYGIILVSNNKNAMNFIILFAFVTSRN